MVSVEQSNSSRREMERRIRLNQILTRDGKVNLKVKGHQVEVRRSQEPGVHFKWEFDGKTHHSAFWPNETINAYDKDSLTFYEVSAVIGLDRFIPAGEWVNRHGGEDAIRAQFAKLKA